MSKNWKLSHNCTYMIQILQPSEKAYFPKPNLIMGKNFKLTYAVHKTSSTAIRKGRAGFDIACIHNQTTQLPQGRAGMWEWATMPHLLIGEQRWLNLQRVGVTGHPLGREGEEKEEEQTAERVRRPLFKTPHMQTHCGKPFLGEASAHKFQLQTIHMLF